LKHLKQLAIDEISIGEGQQYLAIVLDLGSGAVVLVGDGKGADGSTNCRTSTKERSDRFMGIWISKEVRQTTTEGELLIYTYNINKLSI
jgi:hypothetical protein